MMDDHRLDPLLLLPPATETPWTGVAEDAGGLEMLCADGKRVAIDLPLFWYDPPWCDVASETADILACAVAQTGVLVSALRSDLTSADHPSRYHGDRRLAGTEKGSGEPEAAPIPPRIVPYRPERYGLSVIDFDGAKVIDVRLTMPRDSAGRFAFSPAQIERWESTPTNEPLAGGGWVPAASFPPDVVSMAHLENKLSQLRSLSPNAAVLVSVNPFRLKSELPSILGARPDGVILRLDEIPLEGLQLAALTRRARKLMDDSGASTTPLWVVPGDVTPEDAVKLVALGASAIAVDSWCNPLLQEATQRSSTAARLGYSKAIRGDETYFLQLTQHHVAERIERFRGLKQSLLRVPPGQRLGSFSSMWAQPLEVRPLR